jgi:putative inorganic carbon (hco3(-)) transporter
MNSVMQWLTWSEVALDQYARSSYLHRLVGILEPWRQGSAFLVWGEALGAMLMCVVLALAPFIDNSAIAIILVSCSAAWLLLTLADKVDRRALGLTPIHLILGLYWLISLLSTALSPHKKAALVGLGKLSLYLLVFLLLARVLRVQRWRNVVISVYLFTALIVSTYGIRQWFGGVEQLATWVDPTSDQAGITRVFSYLGNPNLLSAYLIPAIAFSISAIFVWQSWGPKILAGFMASANSLCLILTFSRGGWLGMVLTLVSMALMVLYWERDRLPERWRSQAIPVALTAMALFLIAAIVLVPALRLRVLSLFVGRGDSSNNFRLNVWGSVLQMIQDRPIFGIGPGNSVFNKVYPLYQKPRFTALSAYSIFLEVLVETGVIGFVAFLWFIATTVTQGLRQLPLLYQNQDRQAFWLMAAIATIPGELGQGLFDTVWYRPEVNTLWWLSVGLIAAFVSEGGAKLAPATSEPLELAAES